MLRACLCLATVLALAPASLAELIRVPQDVSDLQTAIDGAAPGDVIALTGGTWDGVVIDKSLTLVGSASEPPSLRHGEGSFAEVPGPCVRLDDAGRVALIGLDLTVAASGVVYSQTAPAIDGSVDELLVLHCTVDASTFQPTGYVAGSPAIAAQAQRLLVADSLVVGGGQAYDGPTDHVFGTNPAALFAYADVLVVDSSVTGGAGPTPTVFGGGWLCGDEGGTSGPAIAGPGRLVHVDSTLSAGAAGTAAVYEGPAVGEVDQICALPVAADLLVAEVLALESGGLHLSPGGMAPGGVITVSVDALGASWLLTGEPLVPGVPLGLAGLLHVDPAAGLQVTPFTADEPLMRTLDLDDVPDALVGAVVAFQVASADGLTRPAFAAVLAP